MSGTYRDQAATALAEGWSARSIHATEPGAVRLLLESPTGETRVLPAEPAAGAAVPSVVDLSPAMGWDEREAHDLYGVDFDGHEPLRPLVAHPADPAAWTVPVHGPDTYQVAVGPIHAGIIESGHFRFHVVGDRVIHVDARLFYKHRGIERAAEGLGFADALAVMARSCAACTVSNSVAFAVAAERLLGVVAGDEMTRCRALLLEMERLWSHLNDIAAVCAGVGMAAGNQWFLALSEQARRLNAALTGHRYLAGAVSVGASTVTADAGQVAQLRSSLADIARGAERGWRSLEFNASFQDRLHGVGVIDAATVGRVGVVGPAARAAGVAEDARSRSPWPDYDGVEAAVDPEAAGDVASRLRQRMLELRQGFALLDRLLSRGPITASVAGPITASVAGPAWHTTGHEPSPVPFGAGTVESPRGLTVCVIEPGDDPATVGRVRLRTGSYANWPAVAEAATKALLPDFPLVNKSFELCYACVDR